MFCRFRPKKGFTGKVVRPTALKIQKNVQDIKGVELLGLHNCYLEILNFLNFDAQKLKKNEIYLPKIQKVFFIYEKRYICDSPYQFLFTYQILDRYLVFWSSYREKTVQN